MIGIESRLGCAAEEEPERRLPRSGAWLANRFITEVLTGRKMKTRNQTSALTIGLLCLAGRRAFRKRADKHNPTTEEKKPAPRTSLEPASNNWVEVSAGNFFVGGNKHSSNNGRRRGLERSKWRGGFSLGNAGSKKGLFNFIDGRGIFDNHDYLLTRCVAPRQRLCEIWLSRIPPGMTAVAVSFRRTDSGLTSSMTNWRLTGAKLGSKRG